MLENKFNLPTPTIKVFKNAFVIKKTGLEMPQGDSEIFELEQDCFPCLYCTDRISEEVIETHMSVCPSNNTLLLDSPEHIAFRLERLRAILESDPTVQKNNSSFYEFLRTKINLLASTSDYSQIKQFKKNIEEEIPNYKKTGTFSRICLRECFNICGAMIKEAQNTQNQNKKDKILLIQLKNVKKHDPFININYQNIITARTYVDSKLSKRRSISCAKPIISATQQNTEGEDKDKENFQKLFYAIGLSIKENVDITDPAQTVSLSDLFNNASQLRIPPEEYRNFIVHQLKNPSNWRNKREFTRRERKNKQKTVITNSIIED